MDDLLNYRLISQPASHVCTEEFKVLKNPHGALQVAPNLAPLAYEIPARGPQIL